MSQTRAFIVTLGLLTALAALSIDLSLPAVPDIAQSLGTDLPTAQQILAWFMAGLALGQIPAGLLGDRFGRLPVLYAGTLVYALTSVAIAMMSSIEMMLAARFIQGLAAAAPIVISRAIVRDVSSGREAASLLSLMVMIFTIVPVLAPTAGAVLVNLMNWRATFVAIALAGFAMLLMIRFNLHETHRPSARAHPLRQAADSFRLFFTTRQSVLGLLLAIAMPAGFLSLITVSSSLLTETYGLSLVTFGVVFGLAGACILVGSALNRSILARHSLMTAIRIAVVIQAVLGVQFGLMAWLDAAPLFWLWGTFCLFLMTVGMLMPSAGALAMDPIPSIAGFAASITGSTAHGFGAVGAFVGAALYDGSVRNAVITLCGVCAFVVLVFLLRRRICPEIQASPGDAVGPR